MNITHVVATLAPEAGGLSKAVASLASVQASAGNRVDVVHHGQAGDESRIDEAYGLFPGFDRVLRHPVLEKGIAYLTSVRVLEQLDQCAPDIIHCHGLWEPLLCNAQRFARRRGIPYGFTPHGMVTRWHERHHRMLKTVLRKGLGWERLWRDADWVHVLNAEEEREWESRGFKQVCNIPNAVFTEELPESLSPFRSAGERVPDRFVLFLSRLHPQKAPEKALDLFVKIAGDFPELELVFAGPDGGSREMLERKVRAAGLEARVHFTGMLTGDEKWQALTSAEVFVLPSQTEGHSLAVLEAALSGVPMVISEGCEFPELVEAGGAVFWDEGTCLRNLIANPEVAKAMGQAARRLILESYTWDKRLAAVMRMYGLK
jgi:glycosyltransferase involved in cell wall biosynthesis